MKENMFCRRLFVFNLVRGSRTKEHCKICKRIIHSLYVSPCGGTYNIPAVSPLSSAFSACTKGKNSDSIREERLESVKIRGIYVFMGVPYIQLFKILFAITSRSLKYFIKTRLDSIGAHVLSFIHLHI